MQSNAGAWVTSPVQKLELFDQYYTQLYTSELLSRGQIDSFPPIFIPPTISDKQREGLNKHLSLNKVLTAINGLRPNKAPGLDGLNSEFYKTFNFILAPVLYKVYPSVLEGNLIPSTWRESIMILLPKKGKNQADHIHIGLFLC